MAANTKHVLVFGDSNAWGWIPRPEIFPTQRLDKHHRWPEIMATGLGAGWSVICDALPGRTTNLDDPTCELGAQVANGARASPGAIGAHMPLDLVILALGTNDLKEPFQRSGDDIAEAIVTMAQAAAENTGIATTYPAPKLMILCPPPLGPLHPEDWAQEVFSQGSLDKSRALAAIAQPMVETAGFAFVDAGRIIETAGVDGVHFDAANHVQLGNAMAGAVRAVV